jgi:hypothetical protein
MRKIYQSAPDVPQAVANKAIDIIERHFAANGVRRAEELPEESKIRLMRELQKLFYAELGSHSNGTKDLINELSTQGDNNWWIALRRLISKLLR